MARVYSVLHLFCGIGGGALGFQRARARFQNVEGRFETLLGVDSDPQACADFEALTGAPSLIADLAELTPARLLEACRGRSPDVVFLSAPCKGFSGLLPAKRLGEERYQRLNRLMLQALWCVMETWPTRPPKLVVSENVPRIAQRGVDLIRQVRQLLEGYGYRHHEDTPCCGEIGGLAQRRRRWLLVARHEPQVPTFIYRPPLRRLLAVGEVLGALPLPDDPVGGPMHRLPRLEWRTWVRLALIPAHDPGRAPGFGSPSFPHMIPADVWIAADAARERAAQRLHRAPGNLDAAVTLIVETIVVDTMVRVDSRLVRESLAEDITSGAPVPTEDQIEAICEGEEQEMERHRATYPRLFAALDREFLGDAEDR